MCVVVIVALVLTDGSRRTILSKYLGGPSVESMLNVPSDEHQRRSPDCLFFNSAVAMKPQANKRGRKERVSRASRMSTQSNVTTASEAPSHDDLEIGNEESALISAMPTPPRATNKKGSKKGAKGRKAAGKKAA